LHRSRDPYASVREDRRAVRPIEWNRSNFPGARLLREKEKKRKKEAEERLLLALYKTEGASALARPT